MEYRLYLSGLSYNQIAKLTNQSINVVKAKCYAQRAKIKNQS